MVVPYAGWQPLKMWLFHARLKGDLWSLGPGLVLWRSVFLSREFALVSGRDKSCINYLLQWPALSVIPAGRYGEYREKKRHLSLSPFFLSAKHVAMFYLMLFFWDECCLHKHFVLFRVWYAPTHCMIARHGLTCNNTLKPAVIKTFEHYSVEM